MSTSGNPPVGFSVTTLNNGRRCTAVPRSLITVTAFSTSSSSSVDTSTTPTTSSTTLESTSSNTPESTIGSTSSSSSPVAVAAAPVITSQAPLPTEPQDTPTPTPAQIKLPSSSPSVSVITSSTSSSELAAPSSTPLTSTPTESTTTTPIPTGRTGLGIALPDPINNQNGPPSLTSSSNIPSTTVNAVSSQQPLSSNSTSKSGVATGPVVGGVVGGIALVGLIAVLLWFLRRRRIHGRSSLLTPLDGERNDFTEIDNQFESKEKFTSRLGAQARYQTDKFKDFSAGVTAGLAGFGASLKSKVARHQRDSPSVDLNRGNSQFFDGPIPQHSRNNSVLSDKSSDQTVKDRFHDWWDRFTDSVASSWPLRRNKRLADPYGTAGGLSEKNGRSSDALDFSQILRINERDLQLQADCQRGASPAGDGLGSSVPVLGSLGLNFDSSSSFADPPPPAASKAPNTKDNPFADPVSESQPTTRNINNYVTDVRRSRGQSANMTKNNQSAFGASGASRPNSRYPSSIGLNRESYRDTVFSSVSANGRKGKGRSDPFDLERPELWMSSSSINTSSTNASQGHARKYSRPDRRGSSIIFPDPLRMSAVQGNIPGVVGRHTRQPSKAHSRTISSELGSIYSSGMSSLADWAGPGPDLGPGSSSTSLGGNASSDGDSHYPSGSVGVYHQGGGYTQGSLSEIDIASATRRDVNNVSPLSMERDWDSRRATDSTSPVSITSPLASKRVGTAL